MTKRETRGGDLNLIRVLRHDLAGEQPPTVVHPTWLVATALAALAATLAAIHIF